jgi:hypothetical protein
MKTMLVLISAILMSAAVQAQNKEVEDVIKKLEQTEVQAVLDRDVATLETLWDKNYVVHNPENKIVMATANPADRPVMSRPRLTFTREVEQITVHDGLAISMGNETVVPTGNSPKSGQTIKRRFTNIWSKVDGQWKLVARHANEICH